MDFAPSGSCILPCDITPSTPRCFFMMSDFLQSSTVYGNHYKFAPIGLRAMSRSRIVCVLFFLSHWVESLCLSRLFKRGRVGGDSVVSRMGFIQLSCIAYLGKSAFWFGISSLSSPFYAIFMSRKKIGASSWYPSVFSSGIIISFCLVTAVSARKIWI